MGISGCRCGDDTVVLGVAGAVVARISRDDGLRRSLPRMVLSCAVMAVAVFAAAQVFGPWLEMSGMRYVTLGLLVAVGAVVYGALVLASGAVRIADLRAALRR